MWPGPQQPGVALPGPRPVREAEPLFQRSLAIWEKVSAPNIPMWPGLNNLARLYRNRGQYGKAEPLYRRALQILKKALP